MLLTSGLIFHLDLVCVDPWEWGRVGRPAFIHSVWTATVCRRGRQVNWSWLSSSSRNSWEHHHDEGYWLYKLSIAVPSKSSFVSVDCKVLFCDLVHHIKAVSNTFTEMSLKQICPELIQQKKNTTGYLVKFSLSSLYSLIKQIDPALDYQWTDPNLSYKVAPRKTKQKTYYYK